MIRPPRLHAGDLVGVCAPAGAVDPERLRKGVAALESLGLRVRVGEGTLGRLFFTSGSASQRRDALQALLADDEVRAIVCARGGAGASALLPLLDPALFRRHPKALLGCSDITFLHLFLQTLDLVSLHGPMVAGDLARGSYDAGSLRHALFGEGAPLATEADDLEVLRAGEGEGVLLGGCLSILASAAGTPWALRPRSEGTLLFLEDVHERPYRIDRMLRQLRQSGAFAGLRGLVFGDMQGCAPKVEEGYSLEAVVLEALEGLEVPVALGLSSGHTRLPALTLPFGVRARLSCDGSVGRFELLEPALA
ncbi:MAG TPA: LD-carboxypeptidase [Vicinamibacteria bacterium]